MMRTTHTPGPWCLDPHQRPEEPLAIFDGPNCGTLIATIPGDQDEPENEANAQLIAAAPDLLAALLETRMGEDRDDGLPCWCPSPSLVRARKSQGKEPLHRPICNLCRAAIRKATPPAPASGEPGGE